MRVSLNESPFYDTAKAAVDAVDTIIAIKPAIPGLFIHSDQPGFSYVDSHKNRTIGYRSDRDRGANTAYSITGIYVDKPHLERADFLRQGDEIYVTHLSGELDELPEIQALKVVVNLGKLAIDQSNQ